MYKEVTGNPEDRFSRNVAHIDAVVCFFRASREEMMVKVRTKSDDVEMKAGLIGHEESVSLQVPDSPGK